MWVDDELRHLVRYLEGWLLGSGEDVREINRRAFNLKGLLEQYVKSEDGKEKESTSS